MKVLFAGDLFVSDELRGKRLFDAAVIDLFARADYRVVNLEAPLTADRKKNRILKTGPHLRASAETVIPALRALRVDLAALANNHLMDYGETGLAGTLAGLRGAGMAAVGAGSSLVEAAKPFVLERDGLRLTFLNFAENEWSAAAAGRPGTNPLDIIDNLAQIEAARAAGGPVVVMIHGGHEYYPLPSPRMRRLYRFYAERGASVIVGHHPHCPGGHEVHRGVPIFYSLGNFYFSGRSPYEDWYTGLVLELQIEGDQVLSWNLVPVRRSKSQDRLGLLPDKEADDLLRRVGDLSRIISDAARLGREWEGMLAARRDYYLDVFSPSQVIRSRRLRTGLTRLGLGRLLNSRKYFAQVLNHLRCESHSDAARAVIERFLDRTRTGPSESDGE